MASLYKVNYETTNGEAQTVFAVATSDVNAWAAAQAADGNAANLQEVEEERQNVLIGS
jgi:hypothetical protein